MAPSASGIFTLLAIIVAGPLYYLGVRLRNRLRGTPAPQPTPQPEATDGREQSGSGAYLVSLLGYAIGIGNVWRFPYLVGKYGGGAFVFAYLVCLFLVAIPLYMMELIIGQHTRLTTIPCFTMIRPRWRSLGWAQAVMLCYGLAYYNVLIAYACNYIVGALSTPLPWSEEAQGVHVGRGAAERFWTDHVLHAFPEEEGEGGGSSALGPVQGNLAGALFAVWTMVFFALAFGKELLAQVTWVTVVGPVVLMFLFIIRTAFLPGAGDGIAFYLGKFDFEHLLNLDLWAIACGQILFSLSPGMGTATA
jgi:SNF family Na+-dependent transporter